MDDKELQNHIDPFEVTLESTPQMTPEQQREAIGKGGNAAQHYSMTYIDASIQEYKEGIGHFQEKMPEVVRGYLDFTGACFAEGTMSEKQKQLMALAISIHIQDEYCMMYHTATALDKGASEQEVLETIAVAAAFGGGAAFSQGVTLVMDVLDQYNRVH